MKKQIVNFLNDHFGLYKKDEEGKQQIKNDLLQIPAGFVYMFGAAFLAVVTHYIVSAVSQDPKIGNGQPPISTKRALFNFICNTAIFFCKGLLEIITGPIVLLLILPRLLATKLFEYFSRPKPPATGSSVESAVSADPQIVISGDTIVLRQPHVGVGYTTASQNPGHRSGDVVEIVEELEHQTAHTAAPAVS